MTDTAKVSKVNYFNHISKVVKKWKIKIKWGCHHGGLDGDGGGVGLTLRHLWLRQRLEFRLDEFNRFLPTVDCHLSAHSQSGCTWASGGSLPADGTNCLTAIRTGWIAEAVLFDKTGGAAVRTDSNASFSACSECTCSTPLYKVEKEDSSTSAFVLVGKFLFEVKEAHGVL